MSASLQLYSQFQASNPETDFNESLIHWRSEDDVGSYLEDIFKALEVVPGIKFHGVTMIRDESKFPKDLISNNIEQSRVELAQMHFTLDLQDTREDITLSIFLPKLIDDFFYVLNGSTYYPILQIVDRGTYVTKKTFTLKTLLMPLMFRRDMRAKHVDTFNGDREHDDMLYVLDLFRNRINVLRYFFASKGLAGTLQYFGVEQDIVIAETSTITELGAGVSDYRCLEIRGSGGLVVVASNDWLNAIDIEPSKQASVAHFRSSMLATVVSALDGIQQRFILEDDIGQWKRRLGKHFTQNSNGFEEKADKILISLERILDQRTRKNLAHVHPDDKSDVYAILRWMMRDYRTLIQVDGLSVKNKRIRMSEYLIHPLLMRFSESTYRLLNSKNLTFRGLRGVFNSFIYNPEDPKNNPQVDFLIKKLTSNELLRYSNMTNSFDLLTALRWTARGPQTLSERGRVDVSLKARGHHPSFVGRICLSTASAGDPGVSGTFVPFAKTKGQFFL